MVAGHRLGPMVLVVPQFNIELNDRSLESTNAVGQPGDPLPQADRGEAVQVHLARLQLCRGEEADPGRAHC